MHLIAHRTSKPETLLAQGQQTFEELVERAAPYARDLVDRTAPVARDLADRATPYARDLAARATPYVESAREHLPIAKPKKSHKVRNTLLVLGAAGAAAAAYWFRQSPSPRESGAHLVPPQPTARRSESDQFATSDGLDEVPLVEREP